MIKRLRVLTPVLISAGTPIPPAWHFCAGDQVYFLEPEGLYNALGQDWDAFLSEIRERPREARLGRFLGKRPRLGPALQKHASYSLLSLDRDPGEVHPFIKLPGQPPEPYIPGSSVKGFLRTALLYWALKEGKGGKVPPYAKALEDEIFRSGERKQGPAWDLLRFLSIPDSHPLSLQNLYVARLEGKARSGMGRRPPVWAELLRPGVAVEFQVAEGDWTEKGSARRRERAVKEQGLRNADLVSHNRVRRCAYEFSLRILEREGPSYPPGVQQELQRLNTLEKPLLRLGMHKGYFSNTIGLLLTRENLRDVVALTQSTIAKLPHRRRERAQDLFPNTVWLAPVPGGTGGRWPLGWVRWEE